jgi:vacuolar protein sorting-associated protein 13A/C
LKGIAKGLVGVVTKPLTGVFDLASHTTEGMKGMVTYFDDRANEEKKRMPRAFYGRERYFKKYNESEASLLNELKVFDDGKYAFDHFIKKFDISQFKSGDFILIVTFEHLIYFNQSKHSIIFVIEPENITSIDKDAAGLKVLYNDNSKIKDTSLLIKNDDFIDDIINTVNEVRYVSLCTSHRIY